MLSDKHKKNGKHLPIRQRGSRSPYAQIGNAYRINGKACSLFYVRIDNFDFSLAQIYKIIELQSTEFAVFFSEYYPQTIEFA